MMPRAIPASVNAWVLPGALADRDYATGQNYGAFADTLVRASSGFANYADGSWAEFGTNVARQTDLGVLTETSGKNWIRNSRFVGCFEPNWFGPNISVIMPAGMPQPTIVDTNTVNGIPSLRLRFSGTNSAGVDATLTIRLETTTAIPATSTGGPAGGPNVITESMWLSRPVGDFTAVRSFRPAGIAADADGSALVTALPDVAYELDATPRPFTFVYTIIDQTSVPSTLATDISAVATSMSVQPGGGASYPDTAAVGAYYLKLSTAAAPSVYEFVKVTNRTVNTFTIVRAQRGTTAQAWSATATRVQNTTAFYQPTIRAVVASGGTISFDLVIGFPQIEIDVPAPSSPMLNPAYVPGLNLVPNPTFAGGVPGTSTFPTNYSFVSTFPQTATFVGLQTVNGQTCMVARFTGVGEAIPASKSLLFEPSTTVPGSAGDTFNPALQIALLAGSVSNLPLFCMVLRENNVAGGALFTANLPQMMGINANLQQKFAVYAVSSTPNVARVQSGITFAPPVNTAYDFTIAIFAPNLDKNNPVGTVAPTRAADTFTSMLAGFGGTAGGAQIELAPGEWLPFYTALALTDGTSANGVFTRYSGADTMVAEVVVSSVTVATQTVALRRLIAGVPSKVIIGTDGASIFVNLNGTKAVSFARAMPPGITTLVKGPVNGFIRRETAWNIPLSAADVANYARNNFRLLQCQTSGQSNGVNSHGAVNYALGDPNFYLPPAWAARIYGVPRTLMFLANPTPVSGGAPRLSDIRYGSLRTSGSAPGVNMAVSDGDLLGATAALSRRYTTSSSGTSIMEGCMWRLIQGMGPNDFLLGANNAVGGVSIQSCTDPPSLTLANGVVMFDAFKSSLRVAKDIADVQGMQHQFILWIHNGHFADGGSPIDVTTTNWNLLKQNVLDAAESIIGTPQPTVFIGSLFGDFQNDQRNSVEGNLLLYQSGTWLMIGSEFAWMRLGGLKGYFDDNLHFNARGVAYDAERYAKAYLSYIATGSFPICVATTAVCQRAVVTVNMVVPVPPLVIDIVNVQNPTDAGIPGRYGVQARLASTLAYVAISSIVPTSNKFIVTLMDDPGENVVIDIALYGYVTPFTDHYVENQQPRANLRDSSTDVFEYDGQHDYGWIQPQTLVASYSPS